MFGPTIIKRVLNSFVPDEFCPDPIPQSIIDALETEVGSFDPWFSIYILNAQLFM